MVSDIQQPQYEAYHTDTSDIRSTDKTLFGIYTYMYA
jgi:hypothetical protein